MTSTPTPEPGERRWVCHKPGWMGPCSPQSTHHNGFDWGCGWIYFPAPSTPGEGTGRPGGWVVGIGWVALASDLVDGDQFRWDLDDEGPHTRRPLLVSTVPPRPLIVTRWADGTTPAPPASPADDVPDADAVAFQNGYQIGVRVGSEHHGPCRGLPPASPVPPTPAVALPVRERGRPEDFGSMPTHPANTYLDEYDEVWIGVKYDIARKDDCWHVYRKGNHLIRVWTLDLAVAIIADEARKFPEDHASWLAAVASHSVGE